MKFFLHKLTPIAIVSLAIIAINLAGAILAPWISPYSEATIIGDVWASPGKDALLGTDYLGRDMLSRLLYGGRLTIGLALMATIIAFVVGVGMGTASAAAARWVDMILSRLVDLLMDPQLILAPGDHLRPGDVIAHSHRNDRAAGCDASVPGQPRRGAEYRRTGVHRGRAAPRRGHLVDRATRSAAQRLPPLIAELGYRFCSAFLFIASLSFLGLGVQPPNADWGSMVRDNATAIALGSYTPIIPAMAITLLAIAVSLLVDWFISIYGRSYKENA